MGQTLTHGVYLPDEGERNCYDGLAANWQLLDGAVGTVAEHTTVLSGKAPLVHTHGKADITDLFNSANTWSGNQTYSGVLSLSSSSDVAEQFKQKLPKDVSTSNDAMARVNSLVDSAGHYVVVETLGHWSNYVAKNTTLKYKNDSAKQRAIEFRLYSDGTGILYPQTPFECDLGNSSNQWNNLYAKNYYYNGTAWGLDKANVWSADQTYSTAIYGQMIWLKNTGLDLSVNGNTGLLGTYQHMIHWADKNNAVYSSIQSWTSSSENTLVLRSKYRTDANTVRDLSVRFTSTATKKVIYPETNADTDLGTSTNKWKTLNGVNPGALSLPDTSRMATIEIPSSWVWDGTTENSYTAPFTGWICIGSSIATNVRLFNNNSKIGMAQSSAAGTDMRAYIPMVAGDEIKISGITSSSFILRVYQCLGNV